MTIMKHNAHVVYMTEARTLGLQRGRQAVLVPVRQRLNYRLLPARRQRAITLKRWLDIVRGRD